MCAYSSCSGRVTDEAELFIEDRLKTHFHVPKQDICAYLSDFTCHWRRVFTDFGVPDSYWSVKWITKHVQRIDQSDLPPQGMPSSVSRIC